MTQLNSFQLSSLSHAFPMPVTFVSICLVYVRMEIPCFFLLRELSEEWHFSVWLSMSHFVRKSLRSHVKCVQTYGRKHENFIAAWCNTSPRFLPIDHTIWRRSENPCWKLDFYFNLLNFKKIYKNILLKTWKQSHNHIKILSALCLKEFTSNLLLLVER